MGSELAVLDASATLALVRRELGREIVAEALLHGAAISSVNLAEVHSVLQLDGVPSGEVVARLKAVGLEVEPFAESDAEAVGDLRPKTKALGLSLADRACLALGMRLGLPVLTADRALAMANVGVEVRAIR